MIPVPTKFKIVAGAAEGEHRLTAFDHALLKAGIANINLVRISSILPPGAQQDQDMAIAPGTLAPTAYGAICSDTPGTKISAAVGVGLSPDTFGVIMEFAGECGKGEAEAHITSMIQEAFKIRELPLKEIRIKSVEHVVEKTASALAAVVLGY